MQIIIIRQQNKEKVCIIYSYTLCFLWKLREKKSQCKYHKICRQVT